MTQPKAMVARLVAVLLLVSGLLVVQTGSVAAATTTATASTCPTDPYTHGTIQSCSPVPTSVPVPSSCPTATPAFTISYVPGPGGGQVTWHVSGLPIAALGTTETLELNGQVVDSAVVDVATGPCTSDPLKSFSTCLPVGADTASAVDPPYPTLVDDFSITSNSGCLNPQGPIILSTQTPSDAASAAPSGGSGALAFTGSNTVGLVGIAMIFLVAGGGVVRLARRRRSTRSIP